MNEKRSREVEKKKKRRQKGRRLKIAAHKKYNLIGKNQLPILIADVYKLYIYIYKKKTRKKLIKS